jgi:Putative auto-transporter adhesin, head GIN domain
MRAAFTLLASAVLAACNMAADAQRGDAAPSSGSGKQRSYAVANFDRISLAGHHNVIVTVGPAVSVRAEGDKRELDRLEITTRGNELRIGLKDKSGWKSRHDRSSVTVYVTVPTLAKAGIGGSGDMRIDTVQGRSFEGSIGGSGDMQIGSVRVERASFSVAGSGNIRTTGQAGSVEVDIAGSGDVDVGGLETRTAEVSIVGSGDVRVRASETADISIMGSGDVTIGGSAKCSVSKMGSGDVRCGA